MPVSRLLDHDVSDSVAAVTELLVKHIVLARELTIARSGKRQPMLERLQIEVAAGENANDVARDAAEQAVEIAENDAGHKTRRYIFAVWGEPRPSQAPPRLDSITITIRSDDDEEDSASTTKAAGRLMSDMGDRHIRLLDQQLTMSERLIPMVNTADQVGAATVKAKGDTDIKLTELRIAQQERKELIELAILFMPVWQGIGNGVTEWLKAKAEYTRAEARATKAERDDG